MSLAAPEPRTRPPGADLRLLVPLRPQGPIEVVDRATHLLRAQAGLLLGLSAAVQLPVWLTLALVFREDWARGLSDNLAWYWLALVPDPSTLVFLSDETLVGGPVLVIVARALPSLALAVLGASYGAVVHRWSLGQACTTGEILRLTARRLPVIVALWALVHALEVGTCIGVVLGPVVFGVATPLCGIEGTGPLRALARSWRLSIRRLVPVAVSVGVATVVGAITAGFIGAVGLFLVSALAGDWVNAGGAATTALGVALPQLVLTPILALSMALLAMDLKVQVEGYDIVRDLAEGDDDR